MMRSISGHTPILGPETGSETESFWVIARLRESLPCRIENVLGADGSALSFWAIDVYERGSGTVPTEEYIHASVRNSTAQPYYLPRDAALKELGEKAKLTDTLLISYLGIGKSKRGRFKRWVVFVVENDAQTGAGS